MLWKSTILAGFTFLLTSTLFAQTPDNSAQPPPAIEEDCPDELHSRNDAPALFLDCGMCDQLFVRSNISFVNFVRDRYLSDIHLLVTTLPTGSGGRHYTLQFIGQEQFSDISHELAYISTQAQTEDEIRQGLTHTIKLGLMAYIAHTPLAQSVMIDFDTPEAEVEVELEDPWNSWVFRVNGSGNLNVEETRRTYRFDTSLSANRTTEDWRIRTYFYANENLRRFESGDDMISSTTERKGGYASAVRSLSDHWSLGFSSSANSSTFNNLDYSLSTGPAVEYNIFPYDESANREFTFAYRLQYTHQDYTTETIFGKTAESLLKHSLEARLRMKETWGETSATVEGSHFLHDPSKNRLELAGHIYLRVAKGLSVRFSSGLELIHDQLYLAKGDASIEELLLQQRQLATTYEIKSSIGLSYTFGSIYNNVVNTRL